jgi:hypothetical protein
LIEKIFGCDDSILQKQKKSFWNFIKMKQRITFEVDWNTFQKLMVWIIMVLKLLVQKLDGEAVLQRRI